MFEILGKVANKIREKIGTIKYTKIYETTPEDWENIPESLKVERGQLKAKVAKLEREVVRLQDALEGKREYETPDIKATAAMREKELKKEKLKKHISFKETINRSVKVMSKDNRLLGYFYDFGFVEGDNPGMTIFCTSKPKGKGLKYKVWEASTIEEMIHNSHTITSQIKAGFITLNRDYEGRFIPDVETLIPMYEESQRAMNGGKPIKKKGKEKEEPEPPRVVIKKRLEDYIGELTQKVGAYHSELNNLKEVLSKELAEKDIIASTRKIEKVKGEIAMTALQTSLNDLTKWFGAFMEMTRGIQEERIKNVTLDATINPLLSNIEDLRKTVSMLRPKDQRDIAIGDIIKIEDMLARLAKSLPAKETIIKEEKAPPAPKGE